MTIRSYKQSLYLIECDDTRVLYDSHRVKTYDGSIEEAAFLCGRDGVSADHPDKAPLSCDQPPLAAIQNRLEHLSGLSKSLSDCQGIVSPFNGHPTLLFMNLCNSCILQCSYCYSRGCGKKHDPRPMSAETPRSGVGFLMQQTKPGEIRQWRATVELSCSCRDCLSCTGENSQGENFEHRHGNECKDPQIDQLVRPDIAQITRCLDLFAATS